MDTRSRGEQPPDAEAAGEAASRHERGGVEKPPGGRRRRRSGLHRGENLFGWLFVSPSLTLLLLFLVAPIILALYISFTNWSGLTSPTSSAVKWVGLENYRTILTKPGLYQSDFGAAVRNNFYFVIFTVPLQTIFALWLAVLVNNKFLRAKGFFRTAFYFPSITSSIAITTIFIFLFQGTGVVNTILGWFGITGPNWLYNQQGIFWSFLSIFGVNGRARMGAAHVPGDIGLGLDFGAVPRDVLHHHPGRVHHVGHVHALFPGRLGQHRRRAGRG